MSHGGGRTPLLVHIPRTAGTSIRSVCPMPPGASTVLNHATAHNWLNMLGLDANRYDLFSVVRHPVDRAWSAWCYLTRQTASHMYWNSDAAERCALAPYESLGEAVAALGDRLCLLPHFAPQHAYTHVEGSCVVWTIRYEKLAETWPVFSAEYGLPVDLPHVNAVHGKPDWREALGPATVDRLRDIYQTDMEAFRYE